MTEEQVENIEKEAREKIEREIKRAIRADLEDALRRVQRMTQECQDAHAALGELRKSITDGTWRASAVPSRNAITSTVTWCQ